MGLASSSSSSAAGRRSTLYTPGPVAGICWPGPIYFDGLEDALLDFDIQHYVDFEATE
jgi:hypothetical protein